MGVGLCQVAQMPFGDCQRVMCDQLVPFIDGRLRPIGDLKPELQGSLKLTENAGIGPATPKGGQYRRGVVRPPAQIRGPSPRVCDLGCRVPRVRTSNEASRAWAVSSIRDASESACTLVASSMALTSACSASSNARSAAARSAARRAQS